VVRIPRLGKHVGTTNTPYQLPAVVEGILESQSDDATLGVSQYSKGRPSKALHVPGDRFKASPSEGPSNRIVSDSSFS
jgi:hypothetical protein